MQSFYQYDWMHREQDTLMSDYEAYVKALQDNAWRNQNWRMRPYVEERNKWK
tara:strand:+ start:4302 stop:4457 length:156 start_codon:yes stop_codon:yes gene_type:complete